MAVVPRGFVIGAPAGVLAGAAIASRTEAPGMNLLVAATGGVGGMALGLILETIAAD